MDKEERLHRVRAAAIEALAKLRLGREEATNALTDCRRQLEHKALVERVVAEAGYGTSRFLWDEHMELYFDLTDNDRDVGCISKGWEDHGFRIAEQLRIPIEFAGPLKGMLNSLRHKCATEGVALTTTKRKRELAIHIECVIYTAGFNGEAVRHTLRYLDECSALVQNALMASVTDSLTA
jgi:hypothetical protein